MKSVTQKGLETKGFRLRCRYAVTRGFPQLVLRNHFEADVRSFFPPRLRKPYLPAFAGNSAFCKEGRGVFIFPSPVFFVWLCYLPGIAFLKPFGGTACFLW